jgi:hypothetical protein
VTALSQSLLLSDALVSARMDVQRGNCVSRCDLFECLPAALQRAINNLKDACQSHRTTHARQTGITGCRTAAPSWLESRGMEAISPTPHTRSSQLTNGHSSQLILSSCGCCVFHHRRSPLALGRSIGGQVGQAERLVETPLGYYKPSNKQCSTATILPLHHTSRAASQYCCCC